ncbi:hypothetical protein E2C01_068352 [Portunus trituberculatus]|uniref:Uncharacterized protein n=1 Tax=Portunus trituberculatus TaxID=210409 RepID=A0A5B7HZ71_PORTR|nr:hypothetical protein [Portunus trituberculatus]
MVGGEAAAGGGDGCGKTLYSVIDILIRARASYVARKFFGKVLSKGSGVAEAVAETSLPEGVTSQTNQLM